MRTLLPSPRTSAQCFQGFCVENDPDTGFIAGWWDFSFTYLKLVAVGHDVRHAGRGSHRGVPVSSGGWRPAFGSWTEGRPSRIDGRHPDDALFGVYRPHLIGLSAEGSGSRGDDSHGAELVHAESARHHHGRHRLHSAPVRITTRAGDHRSLASRTARGVTHGQTGAVSGPATRARRGVTTGSRNLGRGSAEWHARLAEGQHSLSHSPRVP